MVKYRLLSQEELESLEKDFVDYLVVNGIAADDWVSMKTEDPEAAQNISDLFSDVVFEKILRKVAFLEIYEKNAVRSFRFDVEEIQMITMETENENVDFNDPMFVTKAMTNPPNDLLIYKTEKPYSKDRNLEIFGMIENGCLISNGKLHSALESAL